jgi:hypothetical protein
MQKCEEDLTIFGIKLKCSINLSIFPKDGSIPMNVDITRICYVTTDTLVKQKIINKNWNVIQYNEHKTMIYVVSVPNTDSAFSSLEDDFVYVHPAISHILEFPFNFEIFEVFLKDFYDEM